MDEQDDLTAAWVAAQDRLPSGWQLDSLRCASTGLAPGQRSTDWAAMALGPGGEVRTARALDPIAALAAIVAELAEV